MDKSINHKNHAKHLDHCLWSCSMARINGIFQGWTGYFLGVKSSEFQGKILLAHDLGRGVRNAVGVVLRKR